MRIFPAPAALATAAAAGFLLACFLLRGAGKLSSAGQEAHSRVTWSPPPSHAEADLLLAQDAPPFPVPSANPASAPMPMADVTNVQREGSDNSCTVIINVYRGSAEALRIQLNEAIHQTGNASVPHVWVTSFASPNSAQYRAVVDSVRAANRNLATSVDFIESGFNFKFHGRFLLGLMAPTRYILMLDDDAEIDKSTVRRCIDNINTPGRRGVYGGFGHLRGSPERGTEYRSWPNVNIDRKQHPDFYEMEYMSSHWCFETAWLDYFAKERPWTWETGEDMHLSLAVRKFLNLNTYGGVLTRDAPPLPPKGHTATVGRFLEMREHLFDHTVGRGNKIADVRPTIDTLVYVEDASHIDRLIALLDACPDGDAPTGGAASAAWAWPCSIGKTAAVYRGSAVDQDVAALAAAARRLCARTRCESYALKSEFRHPVSHFDLRQDFGHERDAVPLATSAADLVPSLAGVLQNVGPTAFVYAEIEGDAEVVAARHVDGRAWTRGVYGVYSGAVRLAFDAYRGTRENVKFFERETRGKTGDFPTTKAYSWRGGAVVYPH